MDKIKKFITENVALVGLLIVFIIGASIQSAFLSMENLSNLLRSASITGFIAIGMTFVILCGSIDISVGSAFALAGYLFVILAPQNIVLAIIVPLLSGAIVGLINGLLINKMGIPPFIGTLATMMGVRGLVLLVTKESTVKPGELPNALKSLARGTIFEYISYPLIYFIILLLITAYVLKKREVGRNMYIVGGNEDAAKMMGVNVDKTKYIAHIICSVLSSFGGIIFASRVGSASPLAGTGYEMYAIAAVVIGGAQLSGGVGKISGTLWGTLIMGSFVNIFNLQHFINPVWQDAIVGIVLLIVIMFQSIINMEEFSFFKKKKLKLNN